MRVFPYLSDSKLQNSDSTTANLYTLLAWMFEKKQMVEECGIKNMDAQSSIGVTLPNILCLFYPNHIKLFLIEPLIHQVTNKM